MSVRVACEKDARANARGFGVNRCVGAHGNLCWGSEKESVCVCLNSLAQNCHLPLTLAGRRQLGKALMKKGEKMSRRRKKGAEKRK